MEYRRTAVSVETGDELAYVKRISEQLDPARFAEWKQAQEGFWREEHPGAHETKGFFDALAQNRWVCRKCSLPQNPNWARRVQDLKDFGYTIATNTKRLCKTCGTNTTQLLLLPLERLPNPGNGYETWSPRLRARILAVLGGVDVYENKPGRALLPDHKFPEIRWAQSTKAVNPDDMSDQEIRAKFQLLSNQRNQQKREVCRDCFQTGRRGIMFGIPYFYEGTETWDATMPTTGKDAERGCVGCAWYDVVEWRQHLTETVAQR